VPEPVVVSYGSSPYEKREPHELLWHLWQAARACLDRAGVEKDELDGLTLASFSYPPGNVVTLGEHFGLRLRWAEQGVFGGASGVVAVGHAADAIRAGRARAVLCLAGDVFTVATHDAMLESFTPAMRDYLAPAGFGGANGIFSLVQRRHSELYGTTREQLGKIAVTLREHALLNPNALFKEPLTLEEYLDARPIAEPLHLFDCVMPCSGAEAVLVVDEELAGRTGRPAIEVAAMRELHNAHPGLPLSLPAGFEVYADELFEAAGVTRADVDLAELYDDYTIMVAVQLESYGFCPIGGAGAFLDGTDISIRGGLPVNTGGGQLSCGQSGAGGGMIGVTEAVQQLQHEAGARQVQGAEVGLVSGFGLVSYGKGLCTAGAILRRHD
jgi:acetyl-CoA acetyltransferase